MSWIVWVVVVLIVVAGLWRAVMDVANEIPPEFRDWDKLK